MPDMQRLNNQKERILSLMRIRGPSLPVQVAKSIGVSPLFANAFLSELKSEDRIKISDLKVGSSPLYYLPGQENMLENFIEYLNQREREAFKLLKERQILEDEKQTPIIRVALRALKDFALPSKVKIDEEGKIFWSFFNISEEEVFKLIQKEINAKENEEIERKKEEKRELEEKKKAEKEEKKRLEEKDKVDKKEKVKKLESQKKIVSEKPKKTVDSEFVKNVKNYLNEKDMEILEVFIEKKKEFVARIRINMVFGKQEYYLVAKDKKNASDNDLALALGNAQSKKLPAIVMTLGELNKKGKEYAKEWNNLIKFEKMEFRKV